MLAAFTGPPSACGVPDTTWTAAQTLQAAALPNVSNATAVAEDSLRMPSASALLVSSAFDAQLLSGQPPYGLAGVPDASMDKLRAIGAEPSAQLAMEHGLGRCAVVGSSGVLLEQDVAAEIDAHDSVFRFNVAPLVGYEHIVGHKTTHRFVSHSTIRHAMHFATPEGEPRPRLVFVSHHATDMGAMDSEFDPDHGGALEPDVSYDPSAPSLGWLQTLESNDAWLVNPAHLEQTLHRTVNASASYLPSTGMVGVSVSLSLCQPPIDLYGFGPAQCSYYYSCEQSGASYANDTRWHDFAAEQKAQAWLASHGYVRVRNNESRLDANSTWVPRPASKEEVDPRWHGAEPELQTETQLPASSEPPEGLVRHRAANLNELSFEVFSKMARRFKETFFSPSSVSSADGAGAEGDTTPSDPACVTKAPVFVINLAKRPDRLERFGRSLPPSLRQKTCRVAAFEGDRLPIPMPNTLISGEEWMRAHERTRLHVPSVGSNNLTVNAVGLVLSHMSAWHQIIARNLSHGLVAEDDAVYYASEFAEELGKLCTYTQDHDYIQLQSDDTTWPKKTADLLGTRGRQAVTTRLFGKSSYNTGFYALTQAGAKRALALSLPMVLQLDAECGPLRSAGMRAASYVPPLVQASTADSDVQTRRPTSLLATTPSIEDCAGVPLAHNERLNALLVAAADAARELGLSVANRTDIDSRGRHLC